MGDRRAVYVSRAQRTIGAGADHDLVLAIGGDGNQGDTRRLAIDMLHAGQVDAACLEQFQRLFGHVVGPDSADQADIGPESAGGEGLVRAFSARMAGETGIGHGLAGPGQGGAGGDNIEIDGAGDGDHVLPTRSSISAKKPSGSAFVTHVWGPSSRADTRV